MKKKIDNRKTEVLIDENWVEIPFEKIEPGQTFRLFEPNGAKVGFKNKTIFIAEGEPYVNADGLLEIDIAD